ncbi:hypothetical protein ACFQBQ_10990 [Granulicella cerasi]|uniref:Uncharacterized protein n=1 Tax=Granulicella cerasi TaxID=741063 RepID=A0ABW1Z9L4_9BACT
MSFSSRAALQRTESNASQAARDATAARAKNSPLGVVATKPMRDMLFISFSEKMHNAPADASKGVNVGHLMKLVAKNAKQGAQLTPQGVLRWPLTSAKAEDVLRETRELLQMMGEQ